MRIEQVELAGWMPFPGKTVLSLPAGPIAIVGEHDGDPARSNWSGKTSLLEAIVWCLFGVHRKRLDDDVINDSCDRAFVRVRLSGGITITRERPRKGPTALGIQESGVESGKRDAQARIVALLGLDLKDAVATMLVAQGDVEALVSRTSSERRAIVASWLRLGSWIDAATEARGKIRQVSGTRALTRSQQLDAANRSFSNETCTALYSMIAELETKCREIDEKIIELSDRLVAAKNSAILAQRHRRRGELLDQARDLREKARMLKSAIPVAEQAAEEDARLTAELQRAVDERRAAATLVDRGFDGQCPVTCEACPVAELVAEHKAAHERRYRIAREKEAEILPLSESARKHRVGADLAVRDAREAGQKFAAIRDAIAALPSEAPPPVEDVLPLQAEITVCRDEAARLRREIAEAAAQVKLGLEMAERAKMLEEEVATLDRAIRIAQLTARCLSTIPRRIAEARMQELQERANVLLAEHGLRLRLSWDRETQEPAARCGACGEPFVSRSIKSCQVCGEERGRGRREELDLLVSDGGPEEDARAKSGGCRALVGSAVRLAAGAMLRAERGSVTAFALVDEPFGSLDEKNRGALAKRLAWMLGASGLEQALVVAHDAEILDALPHRIVIRRSGGRSTAELAW